MRWVSLRAFLLLGFVIGMPVLALPPVAQRVDELLYGPPPDDFARPPEAPPLQEPIPTAVAQQVAPASYVDLGPAAPHLAAVPVAGSQGLDAKNAAPPALAPTPAFAPVAPMPAEPAGEVEIDDRTMARLQQIRQRLEQLGADYIIVETTETTGQYRFQCRMLLDDQTSLTRPFEALSPDPVSAGEEVLRAVEAWRAAGQVRSER